jgi:hypothetical protein
VTRPRAADDFATIRARMEELRREREGHRLPRATCSGTRRCTAPEAYAGRRRTLAQDWDGPANLVQPAARSGDLIPEHSTTSNKPKPAPAVRYPTCGKVSVECWIDCASCALRFRLAAIGKFTAEKAARAVGWRINGASAG